MKTIINSHYEILKGQRENNEKISLAPVNPQLVETKRAFKEKEMPLDMKIDIPEISKAIKELKNNKAAGPDSICINELLKCKYVDLCNALLHLFNTILNYGKYPEKWKTNIIIPIHKSGDVNDPQNF